MVIYGVADLELQNQMNKMKRILAFGLLFVIASSSLGICQIIKKKKNTAPTGAILVYYTAPNHSVDIMAIRESDTLYFKYCDTEPINSIKPEAKALMDCPVGFWNVVVKCKGYKDRNDTIFVEPGFLTTLNIKVE